MSQNKITNYSQAYQAMLVLISRLDGIPTEHFLQAVIDAVKIAMNSDLSVPPEHPNCLNVMFDPEINKKLMNKEEATNDTS